MEKKNKFFEIKNLADNTAEIRIYGAITKWAWEEYGEVSSESFARELGKLKNVAKLHLRVNSPGGDVFEANAIFNLLKDFSKENNIEIIGYIDGLAASAASFLVLASTKIIMGLGSLYMIHNPWTYTMGNSKELAKDIERLDIIKEAMLDIYMTRAKKSREEISNLMDTEKYFSAKEALEYGFVDEIIENGNSFNNIQNMVKNLCVNNFLNKETLDKKMKEIEARKENKKEDIMPKNLQELKAMHPELLSEYEKEIKAELEKNEAIKIENAIKAERERIKELDKIPTLNDKQKEIVNKAKFEEAKEPKDIMAEFFMSNATKAQAEINTSKIDAEKAGINNIKPSVSNDLENDGTVEAICNAALETYNKK